MPNTVVIGQTLSHYRILAMLVEGGTGDVYVAEDTNLKRKVALKILPTEKAASQNWLERFQREAEMLAALDHPNIVTIYSIEEDAGHRFITGALADGKPLDERIPKGGMKLEAIFDIAIPLADALSAAHEKGITHLHLKPANVLVSDDGRVKVLDFGMGKLLEAESTPEDSQGPTPILTQKGLAADAVPYMSPEQLEGKGAADHRSDIFSMGVLLYEMVTCTRPFAGHTSASLMSSILKDSPTPVLGLKPDLPRHLGRIIHHCLEKSPDLRFQTAKGLRNELVGLRREIESDEIAASISGAAVPAATLLETDQTAVGAPGTVVLPATPPGVTAGPTASPAGTGDSIGRYRIISLIGEGGMGRVYEAEDPELKRRIALKVLPESLARDPKALKRFKREAQAVAALNHPSIVTLHSVEESEGAHFLTMELVRGELMSRLIPEEGVDLKKLLEMAIPLADGLRAAHERGIVHRDLKPSNVMVDREGRVRILDFGIAKRQTGRTGGSQEETLALTTEGVVVGTVPYMSPEQVSGKPTDPRSDIFSLGVILHEMCVGSRPFVGDSAMQVLSAILVDRPAPVNELRDDLPEHLGRIVRRCLEKEPEKRYQTAQAVRGELEELQEARLIQGASGSSHVAAAATVTRAHRAALPDEPQARQETVTQAAADPHGDVSTSTDVEVAVALVKRHRLFASLATLSVVGVVVILGLQRLLAPAPAEVEIHSVAVLPFINTGSDPDGEYLGDGIAESLINSFATLPGMRVVSRSSSFRYKDQEATPAQVGQDLDVDAVITGRVTQSGDELVISAELIDTRRDAQLWGQIYRRATSDIFAVQGEIAQAIIDRFRLAGVAEGQSTPSHSADPEAYRLYLKGRFLWNKRTQGDIRQALELFEQALEIDPSYALAWAGIADCYTVGIGSYLGLTAAEAAPRSIAAARRALELDDSLAEAHTALADMLFVWEWDWTGAESEFRRALELNPNYATAHQWYGALLSRWGRHQEAIAAARRGVELDPLSPAPSTTLALVFEFARQYDEAETAFRRGLVMHPEFSTGHYLLGNLYSSTGQGELAVRSWQEALQLVGLDTFAEHLGDTYDDDGLKGVAGAWVEAPPPYDSPMTKAIWSGHLGELDEAFRWLDAAYRQRRAGFLQIGVAPAFDPLRNDPRFKSYLERLNRPGVQAAKTPG